MTDSPAIAFTVLGGYLGAGKTTLLNRLLNASHGLRIALLINDFGAINIDSELIETQTDQQINLTNGCVCCGLTDGFDAAIDSLMSANPRPQHIVIEASGVADVHSLAQYGKAPGLTLDAVVVVADATSVKKKARDKYVANTVTRQLKAADLLVLNKIDLVTEDRANQLQEWLVELTHNVPIVATTFCELPQTLLLGSGDFSNHSGKQKVQDEQHQHHESYVTWNFAAEKVLSYDRVEAMLAEFPEDLLRGKGFIATDRGMLEWHKVGRYERLSPVSFQSIGKQDTQPSSMARRTTLVAIGLRHQLPVDHLEHVATRYLKAQP